MGVAHVFKPGTVDKGESSPPNLRNKDLVGTYSVVCDMTHSILKIRDNLIK